MIAPSPAIPVPWNRLTALMSCFLVLITPTMSWSPSVPELDPETFN